LAYLLYAQVCSIHANIAYPPVAGYPMEWCYSIGNNITCSEYHCSLKKLLLLFLYNVMKENLAYKTVDGKTILTFEDVIQS